MNKVKLPANKFLEKGVIYCSNKTRGEMSILEDGSSIYITNDPPITYDWVSLEEFLETESMVFTGRFKYIENEIEKHFPNGAPINKMFDYAWKCIDRARENYDWEILDYEDL